MSRFAIIAFAVFLSGCLVDESQAPPPPSLAEFAFRDDSGFSASVRLPDPLPPESFQFSFKDTGGDELNSTFHYAEEGAAGCYFSRGMPTICTRVPGTSQELPDRISDGSRVSEQRIGDVTRYLLDDGSFADFRGSALQRFGLVKQNDYPGFSYDRVPQ